MKSHNRIFAVHIHRIVRSNCGVSLSSVAVVLVVVGVVVVFAKRGSPLRDNLDPSLTQDNDWKSIGVPPPSSQVSRLPTTADHFFARISIATVQIEVIGFRVALGLGT